MLTLVHESIIVFFNKMKHIVIFDSRNKNNTLIQGKKIIVVYKLINSLVFVYGQLLLIILNITIGI